MAKNWRCLIGRHDWREAKSPEGYKYAECTRCGMRDWERLDTSAKWPHRGRVAAWGGRAAAACNFHGYVRRGTGISAREWVG